MESPPHQSQCSRRLASWRTLLLGWFDPGAPHPYRGPFTRWPRITDGALALLVFTGSVASVTLSALGDGEDYTLHTITGLKRPALALLGVAAIVLLRRRHQPIAVAAAVTATIVVWAVAGYGDGNDLALVAAMYAVGRYASEPLHSAAALAAAIALSELGTVVDTNQRIDVVPAIILPLMAWYVGRRVRNRGDYLTLLRERSERLEADQEARARRAVADERSRIARELHDVVAHQVSMMTVQAGAAKTIARTDPDTAIDSMHDVERAGRQALGELRHLLGVLRADSTDPDHLGPQPGLADLPDLVDHLTHTGADLTLTLDHRDDLTASVQLSAYRIIQESITNIIKHAGPDPTVAISVGVDGHVLVIEIVNTTDSTEPWLLRSGYGIAGMRERANLLGGTLTAEPVPPDRFRVLAHLPIEPEKP